HRDVKPANVMLDETEEPLLTDFGLAARHQPGDEGPGSDGHGAGTPAYMAPEQARGEAIAASDQYSVGCSLYQLLTGMTPFSGQNALHFIYLHEKQPVPRPRGLNRHVPRDLEAICLKCLAKDPARRYPSCQALADDLRNWLENRPVEARWTPPWERAAKWY